MNREKSSEAKGKLNIAIVQLDARLRSINKKDGLLEDVLKAMRGSVNFIPNGAIKPVFSSLKEPSLKVIEKKNIKKEKDPNREKIPINNEDYSHLKRIQSYQTEMNKEYIARGGKISWKSWTIHYNNKLKELYPLTHNNEFDCKENMVKLGLKMKRSPGAMIKQYQFLTKCRYRDGRKKPERKKEEFELKTLYRLRDGIINEKKLYKIKDLVDYLKDNYKNDYTFFNTILLGKMFRKYNLIEKASNMRNEDKREGAPLTIAVWGIDPNKITDIVDVDEK